MVPYFTFLGRQIPFYGLCFYIGVFLAAGIAALICKKVEIERFDIVGSAVYTMIGAVIGAKLLFLIVSWKTIMELHLSWEAIINGGFVFYGGLLGGILGLWIYCRQFYMNFAKLADIYAVVVPLGHAFGRVGCFFAGCCYGIAYDGPFSITYSQTLGNTPLNVPLFPIQLLEAGLLLLLFAVSAVVFCKKRYRRFDQTLIYLTAYPIIRFTLEFLRGDRERGTLGPLSTSQWISLLLLVTVCLVIWRKMKGRRLAKDRISQ